MDNNPSNSNNPIQARENMLSTALKAYKAKWYFITIDLALCCMFEPGVHRRAWLTTRHPELKARPIDMFGKMNSRACLAIYLLNTVNHGA